MTSATARPARKPPLKVGYQCSCCDKIFPSPEAGSAHLAKRHNGYGFLAWQDYRNAGLGA